MNGTQIERLLELIDRNVGMTRSEAAAYILRNKDALARELASSGSATIQTRAGAVRITIDDLSKIAGSVTAAAA